MIIRTGSRKKSHNQESQQARRRHTHTHTHTHRSERSRGLRKVWLQAVQLKQVVKKKNKKLISRSFLPYLQFSYIPAFLYPQGIQIIVNNPTVEAVLPVAQTNSYKWKENGLIACY